VSLLRHLPNIGITFLGSLLSVDVGQGSDGARIEVSKTVSK
jgi:hypothetical protein